jgi:hypothetical protein
MIRALSGAEGGHVPSLIILILVGLSALSIIVRTLRNGVAPMPTSGSVRSRITAVVTELSGQIGPPYTLVELGSGWGSLSVALSRAMPKASVVGYENSPVPYLFSLLLRTLLVAGNLRILRRDFNTVSLRDADMVLCYLSPGAMARLQPKFAAELKQSALIVSSTFALPEWKPSRVEVANDVYRTRIYVYHAARCRSEAARNSASIPLRSAW